MYGKKSELRILMVQLNDDSEDKLRIQIDILAHC